MPSAPLARSAAAGAEIQCYIAGQLAFTGIVDRMRVIWHPKGQGAKRRSRITSSEISLSVQHRSDLEYTIKLSARGKTKRLIDSSHQHPTTNMMQPTTKEVVQSWLKPFKISARELERKEIRAFDRFASATVQESSIELQRSPQKTATSCMISRDASYVLLTVLVSLAVGVAILLFSIVVILIALCRAVRGRSQIQDQGQGSAIQERRGGAMDF